MWRAIDSSHSNQFVVRTSEKEVELVQAGLDQLLRDKDGQQALLKKIGLKAEPLVKREARMQFFDSATNEPIAGSPGMVKTLLSREVRKALGLSDKQPLPCIIEVVGEGQGTADESYKVVKVSFRRAKGRACSQGPGRPWPRRSWPTPIGPQPDRLENFDSQLATDTRYRANGGHPGQVGARSWCTSGSGFGSWTFGPGRRPLA